MHNRHGILQDIPRLTVIRMLLILVLGGSGGVAFGRTFTVSDFTDNANVQPPGLTLRQAIQQANASPGPDEIVFAAHFGRQTISLTQGEIEITSDLAITGQRADRLVIDGQRRRRIFSIAGGAMVEFRRLTIQNGRDGGRGHIGFLNGGAIFLHHTHL